MKKEVIIALDVAGKDPAITFLKKFQDTKPYIKVGMELFTMKALISSGKSKHWDIRDFWI